MNPNNRYVVSAYGGASCAIILEGDEDFIERGFNGLCNYGGMNISRYFRFKYVVGTLPKLEGAFKSEGRAIKMCELWRGVKGPAKNVTQKQEEDFAAQSEEFGAQYAKDKMSQVEFRNFMSEILRLKNSAHVASEY